MIQIQHLHKTFKKNRVLSDLNLELNHSGITALLGPNGSGKTTLIKCILGMVIPDKGNVLINDLKIAHLHSYREKISYLPQIARFPANLTGRELLNFMKGMRSTESKEEELIQYFGLKDEMDKKMSVLSGGTRQKFNLVIAFMFDSPIIILDEPSTGLDPLALIQLKKYLRKEADKGKQIFIITHILNLVEELAEKIVFILDGKIYYHGSLKELIKLEGSAKLEYAIANILKKDAANI